MDRVIVLVTEGKHESVDYAKVATFGNRIAALEFCKANNTCQQYLKKGRMIFVLGELSSKTIGDKKYVDIIASEIQFL